MKVISAVEHGWLSIGQHGDLTTAEADALAAAESALPNGCLEWRRNRVKFRQFCGVVQIQQLMQIEVLPKVFPHQTPEQQRTTLIEMLDTAGDIEGLLTQQASLDTRSHRLLDVFIRHFLTLLETQLQQGLLRDYQNVEDNLDQVRGRIDLVRQQRENLFNPQRIACTFNELIVDISVNRLLHTALLCMMNLATSPVLRQQINSMRMRFSNVGVMHKGEPLPRVEDLNRMQRRYAKVVELARLLLQGHYLDPRAGQQPVYSLLFDMNQLFERFVAARLRPVARRSALRLMEQGPRRYLGVEATGQKRLQMRPDITLLDKTKRPVSILDAKWKLLESNDPLASLSPSDMYQLSTYANAYRCDKVMLLYPEQAGFQGEHRMKLDLERPVELIVLAIPLSSTRNALSSSLLQ